MAQAKPKVVRKLSLTRFMLTVAASLTGFMLALALLAPAVWQTQITASWWKTITVFLVAHLMNAFVEYVFHRYVLHAPLIPGLTRFYKQHTLHHGLTRITWREESGQSKRRVENRYPITMHAQHEASFFPWYTFTVFGLLATPIFVGAQLLLPSMPIFLGGFAALAWSLILYELLHALEHRPFEAWRPLINHPRWGGWWRRFYAFHLRHHADIRSNETISGFFGLPVTDRIFCTYINTGALYEDGALYEKGAFTSPTPRYIGWLDRLVEKRRQRVRT